MGTTRDAGTGDDDEETGMVLETATTWLGVVAALGLLVVMLAAGWVSAPATTPVLVRDPHGR